MVYLLYAQALGHLNDYFDLLDGDIRKVKNEDLSVDVGINPPNEVHTFRCGRRVKTDFLPTKVRPKGRKRTLPDYCIIQRGQICSKAFRDVVDWLEPKVHQFEPVELSWKDGSLAPQYYWFTPCQRLQTLYREMLKPPINDHSGTWSDFDAEFNQVQNPRLVYRRELVGEHHVWCDAHMNGYICVSGRFHDAATATGLTGLRMNEQETA